MMIAWGTKLNRKEVFFCRTCNSSVFSSLLLLKDGISTPKPTINAMYYVHTSTSHSFQEKLLRYIIKKTLKFKEKSKKEQARQRKSDRDRHVFFSFFFLSKKSPLFFFNCQSCWWCGEFSQRKKIQRKKANICNITYNVSI